MDVFCSVMQHFGSLKKCCRNDFILQSWATAWCVLRDLLGFMHNALCVSWEGWTSDREHWVPSRISNGLRSLSLPSRLDLSPLSFILFAGNSQHHWCGLFLCVAWEQKKCTSLACYHRLSLPLCLCLSTHLSLSLQSPSLPFFYVSVLMIYFCKNVWPVLSQSLKCLFKREIHVNYFYLRQAQS